jgi:hypothetical protein
LWEDTLGSFADVGKGPGLGHATHAMGKQGRVLTASILPRNHLPTHAAVRVVFVFGNVCVAGGEGVLPLLLRCCCCQRRRPWLFAVACIDDSGGSGDGGWSFDVAALTEGASSAGCHLQ